MKTRLFLFFLLICGLAGSSIAQNTNNIWYFGDGNFLDFNTATPTISGNGTQVATATSTYCIEGASSICDNGGNLLFYTDGRTVWDNTFNEMPNGTGLNSSISAAQCIIVPKPGSTTSYYVFHADFAGNANGLSYSEVDLTLNNGLGDVTANKNIQLHTPASEQMKAITHCNGTDIWLLSHSATGNTFYAYEITPAGVNTTATTTNIGTGLATVFDGMSYMSCTKDGSRIALATGTAFELFDFDNQSGTLCNNVLVPTNGFSSVYGIEFSPDATKVYTTDFNLTQWDISSNNPTTIAATAYTYPVNEPAAIMRGPNDNLYVASGCDWYDAFANQMFAIRELHTIDAPNLTGVASSFNQAQFTTPRECGLGLTNTYVPTQTTNTCGAALAAAFTATPNLLCEGDCVAITNNSTGPIVSTNWTFPGGTPATFTGATPPNVCYATAGIYTITVSVESCNGQTETSTFDVTVNPCTGTTVNFSSSDQNLCLGDCISFQDLSNGTNITAWSWSFPGGTPSTSTDQFPTAVCYPTAGSYDVSLTITDDNGNATTTETSYITVQDCSPPTASFDAVDSLCAGTCTQMTDLSIDAVSWNWTIVGGTPSSSTDQNPEICFPTDGIFTIELEVTNAAGFTNTTSKFMLVQALPFVDAGPDLTVEPDQVVNIGAFADPGTVLWTPPTYLSCDDCLNPDATGTATTTYTLSVTNVSGCTATDDVLITLDGELLVYVPNAFTPNGDGKNDVFLPVLTQEVLSYELIIYDRWGNVVFRSNNQDQGWDGAQMSDGIYVWTLKTEVEVPNAAERKKALTGHLTLLK